LRIVINFGLATPAKLSAIIFIVALTPTANANIILEQSGTVNLGTVYHSNISFLPDNLEESVMLYQLIPEYKISALDDRNTWLAKIGVQIERSSNTDIAQNVENPFAQLGWTHEFFLGQLTFQADYIEQRVVQSQFGLTGAVTENGTSVAKTYDIGWNYNFAPKWLIETGLTYNKVTFTDVELLTGFVQQNGIIKLNYLLNETITPYGSFEAFDFQPEDDQFAVINQWQQYLLGANIELSPKFTLDVNSGIVRFNADVNDQWVGSALLNYVKNRHSIAGFLSRTVFPTGESRVISGDALGANYAYELSARSSVGLDASITQNDDDLKTNSFSSFYTRDLSSEWLVRLGLTYREIDNSVDKFNDTSFALNFIYTTPNF
jgi:hypothetical protein